MPDRVTSETRIGNWRPSQGFSWSGIHFEKDDEVVIGRLRDKSKLNLNWSLPRASWKKDNAWRFAEALQDSLSMISGEVTQLRYQRSYRGTHLVSEIRAGYKTSALGLVFRLFDYDIVNKELWLHLARFLSQNTLESDICKRIFRQISDAAQQNTRQGTELLSATILEAALRSLYNHPFSPELNKRTDSFKLEAKLRTFQEQYLSQDILTSRKWRRVNGRLVEAQRRLRDRNAHPDWLSTPGGSFSPEELKQSTNDLIFLSRYYGYMILALSGRKDLQPVFPASIDKWKPIVQVNTTHPADVTESSEQTTSENEEE